MWHRLKPALALVLLAPLIAEYLLGSLTFGQLVLFPIMVLMYGAGALFIREVARRSGRGWPTIVLLGMAYGLVEEGLATQSLFNPHYLGLRLLDYGYIPLLGIGAPWTAYVVLLHVAWSIAVPIGFVESLFPGQRTTPWLGKPGLAACGVIYACGADMVAYGSRMKEHFVATVPQLSVTALLAGIAAAAAFVFFRPSRLGPAPGEGTKWRPAALGLVAFIAGSAFHLAPQLLWARHLSPSGAVAVSLLLPAFVVGVVCCAKASAAWSDAQTDGLVLGGLLAYCWLGFFLTARLHGARSVPGQFFPFVIILGLVSHRFIRVPRFAVGSPHRRESRRG